MRRRPRPSTTCSIASNCPSRKFAVTSPQPARRSATLAFLIQVVLSLLNKAEKGQFKSQGILPNARHRLPKSFGQELESDAGCQPALPIIERGKGFCFQQQRCRHVEDVQRSSQISGCALSG